MIMSKCQSVISSSSRDLRDTVPTRDSRRDLNEILTVSTSNMHPSSSPSSLRGDRRVHRVPDLPREDKNLHTLRLSQHSSSPCSPRTEASAPVRSPPSSSHVMHRGRPSLRIGSCLARPAPRTRVLRPPDPTSLSAAAVRAALSLLYLSTLALSRDSTCLSLSICARFFTPSKRNLSSSSRPSRRSSSDNHESQNHTYCTGTGTGTPHVNTHRSPPSIQRAFCPSRSAISTSSSRARAHRRTTNQFRGGGSNHLRRNVLNTALR